MSLSEVLRSIGSGSLPLGRLFEGHVNALELVLRYGNDPRVKLVAEEARAGNYSASGIKTTQMDLG